MNFQGRKYRKYFVSALAPALLGITGLTITGMASAAPCQGPGAPTNTQTKCLTAIPPPRRSPTDVVRSASSIRVRKILSRRPLN
jgi:hypothetical protein